MWICGPEGVITRLEGKLTLSLRTKCMGCIDLRSNKLKWLVKAKKKIKVTNNANECTLPIFVFDQKCIRIKNNKN